jgi:hypothetical protein
MSHSPDSWEPFGLRSYFLWACVNTHSAFPSTGWWEEVRIQAAAELTEHNRTNSTMSTSRLSTLLYR